MILFPSGMLQNTWQPRSQSFYFPREEKFPSLENDFNVNKEGFDIPKYFFRLQQKTVCSSSLKKTAERADSNSEQLLTNFLSQNEKIRFDKLYFRESEERFEFTIVQSDAS